MKEKIIEFKTAKLAQEKGFECILHSYYILDSEELCQNHVTIRRTLKSATGSPYGQKTKEDYEAVLSEMDNSLEECILAPTQSLLQKWLREEHNIFIYCMPNRQQNSIKWTNNFNNREGIHFNTYEQALEKGLFESLKLIK